jgi:hypothetical protein
MTGTPAQPKAAVERAHDTYIINGASGDFHQAQCDTPGCGWSSPEFDDRRYLAEMAIDEHQRAVAGWPGTAPGGTTPSGDAS